MINYRVLTKILDAQDRVFSWMQNNEYDRESGSKELTVFPEWQEAWQTWWDEGED